MKLSELIVPEELTSERILHKTRDDYSEIIVKEHNLVRSLYFGSKNKQSSIFVPEPSVLVLQYTQAMTNYLLFSQQPKRILVVGLGGASLIHFFRKALPECNIDVVELRESVVEIAQSYFYFNPYERNITVHVSDARKFLDHQIRVAQNQYDAIFIDIFDDEGPASITNNSDFYHRIKVLLSVNGIAVINLWNRKKDSYQTIYKQLSRIFKGSALELVLGKVNNNVVVFCFSRPIHLKYLKSLHTRALALKEAFGIDYQRFLKLMEVQNFGLLKKIRSSFPGSN